MVQQTEVGVQDFVLLDEITLEKFMGNLQKRWVFHYNTSNKTCFLSSFLSIRLCACVYVLAKVVGVGRGLEFAFI